MRGKDVCALACYCQNASYASRVWLGNFLSIQHIVQTWPPSDFHLFPTLKGWSEGCRQEVVEWTGGGGLWRTWCFSDRTSWYDYILITNLLHWLLFIHKILFSSTCFEHQVLIFRRIQLYTCSIWYCHFLWEFVVACRYTTWVRTDCMWKVVGGCRKTPTNNLPPTVS